MICTCTCAQTITDEEVAELRSAMTREEGWATQPDDAARFQQEHADLLDSHMQCLRSGDDGPDQRPLWLRQVPHPYRSLPASTQPIADHR